MTVSIALALLPLALFELLDYPPSLKLDGAHP